MHSATAKNLHRPLYRFDRWLYIVDFIRLKSGKLPDTDGTADAAETSSS
ncbi:hypothetical protein T08_6598 [Trichinella sp. T8]|nr:hypothetical protein T08_6598 [Trichinella sp. T8]